MAYDSHTYYDSTGNKLPVKKTVRSHNTKTQALSDMTKKKIRVTFVFPDRTSETDTERNTVQKEVREILAMELRHQIQH